MHEITSEKLRELVVAIEICRQYFPRNLCAAQNFKTNHNGAKALTFAITRSHHMKRVTTTLLALHTLFFPIAFAQSIPNSVEQRVRQIYSEKYPDNFSMQKTLIQDQLASYQQMQSWTSEPGVPRDIFNAIKEVYVQKYPDNYSMQKTLVKDQCESYRFLQSYTSVPGVPENTLSNLKQKYLQKYPYNFSMQKTLVQDQVKSYLELQR